MKHPTRRNSFFCYSSFKGRCSVQRAMNYKFNQRPNSSSHLIGQFSSNQVRPVLQHNHFRRCSPPFGLLKAQMKHALVSSSNGQTTVTAVTENPLRYPSLTPKRPENHLRPRYSRAKQLFSALRNITSASPTPSASPSRASGNGYVCRIPRACCRYNSPNNAATLDRLPCTVAGEPGDPIVSDPFERVHYRRRTGSDSSPGCVAQVLLDNRALKCSLGGMVGSNA